MEIWWHKQDLDPQTNFFLGKPLRQRCPIWGPGEGQPLVCLTRRYLGVRCDAQYPPAQLRRWVGTLAASCTSEGSRTALGFSQR